MTERTHRLTRRTLLRHTTTTLLTAGLAASCATAPARTARPAALVRSGRPAITHGVQSGDITADSAIVWARADRSARLTIDVSRDPEFRTWQRVPGPAVGPGTDFTGRVDLRDLPSGTKLHYRVFAADVDDTGRAGEAVQGRLRTAPRQRGDISFVWGGDIAGQGWGVNPDAGGFPIAGHVIDLDPDFFLCSGDTVYADMPVDETVTLPDGAVWRNLVTGPKTKVAESLDEFRGQYRYNLLADNWRTLLARTPQVNQWDDHEVTNNRYPGEILDDDRYTVRDVDVLAARAERAFHEYVPVRSQEPDRDGRIYRKLAYGPLLDVFVLDMRSYRDANAARPAQAAGGRLLGGEQTAWLKRELDRSRAVWKVIAASMPIGLVVSDDPGHDGVPTGAGGAPLGREGEIADLLSFLRRAGIRNHVWLTADVHYPAAHHYSPERAAYTDFDPFWEFVAGPLNAGAFLPNPLDPTFGPEQVFVASPPRDGASPAEGHQYVGEVVIAGETAEMTVRLRGIDGTPRWATTLTPAHR